MFGFLRSGGASQYVMGGIALAVLASFGVTSGFGTGGSSDVECAVKVGKHCVPPRDFASNYRLLASGMDEKTRRQIGVNQVILDGLVERTLLNEEAERMGLTVTDEQVDAYIRDGRAFFSLPAAHMLSQNRYTGQVELNAPFRMIEVKKDGKFSYRMYEKVVQYSAALEPKDFKKKQRDELLAATVREAVMNTAQLPLDEIRDSYFEQKNTASARVINLNASWFARFGALPSSSELDAYIKEHQKDLDEKWTPLAETYSDGCRLVQELEFQAPQPAPSPDRDKAIADAAAILARIKDGESFEVLARSLSKNRNAELGGQVICLKEAHSDEVVTALNAGLEGLAENSLSGVIETDNALFIIKAGSLLKGEALKKAMLQHWAKEALVAERAKNSTERLAKNLSNAAREGKSWDEILPIILEEEVSLDVTDKAKLLQVALEHDSRPKIDISRDFGLKSGSPIPAAFGATDLAAQLLALEVGEVLDAPVPTFNGYAIAQLKEKNIATEADFEKDRATFSGSMINARKAEALQLFIADLKAQKAGKIMLNPKFLPKRESEEG